MNKPYDDLHKAMMAAAENYSMARYHEHLFIHEEAPAKHPAKHLSAKILVEAEA
jgi:hypothetical protein